VVDIDNSVETTFENVSDFKFEVSTLVASESQAGHIVTLHQHPIRNIDTLVD
jgi:hypothetical protein